MDDGAHPTHSHTLAGLPAEMLLRICEHLSQVHAPSVLSFALVSKSFHSLAKALLFRRLTFTLTTPARLRRHTRRCTELLRRHHAFSHVRCVVLVGFDDREFNFMRATYDDQDLKDERNDDEDEDTSVRDYLRWNLGPFPTTEWKVNHQRLHGISDYSDFTWRARADRTHVYDRDIVWAPLAELIRLLPGLTDLIYECPTHFLPCLLQAIHDNMKTSSHITRLHLRTFQLRMLQDLSSADAVVMDPHELALITSRCLHSVWLQDRDATQVRERAGDILPGRQAEALEQMMKTKGLAPNLREVRMSRFPQLSAHIQPPLDFQHRLYAWLPAQLVGTDTKQQAVALRHLGLGGAPDYRIKDAQVQYWNERTDLSALRTLELTAIVDEKGLDELLSLSFPSLTTLTFKCAETPSLGYLDKVKRFIQGLPGLESLCVIA